VRRLVFHSALISLRLQRVNVSDGFQASTAVSFDQRSVGVTHIPRHAVIDSPNRLYGLQRILAALQAFMDLS
jgi:hypothetical protein